MCWKSATHTGLTHTGCRRRSKLFLIPTPKAIIPAFSPSGLFLQSISIPQVPSSREDYSVILFTAGLSLRDLSERLCLTGASRESVRIWVHRFSSFFRPSRRVRRLIAVDETVLKVKGLPMESEEIS